ncbi:hypothetical protein [Rugosimonospora africana]|uniref:Uncharacterized protein n=1 Tax=Rugosimonospora africana TaxID=556532 RepID=A0A8J3R6H2_9ACTN|nr:hypothetical protein [Rugosimonospora africana]GIH20916.1 hypothetical protein Raf01_90880 [Rugosimonospora africana]
MDRVTELTVLTVKQELVQARVERASMAGSYAFSQKHSPQETRWYPLASGVRASSAIPGRRAGT